MDEDDEYTNKKAEEQKNELKPRTTDGKIINKLGNGEVQDSNQMEQIPNPFAAEQTYITEADIKNARKGSYDNLDQDMPSDIPEQIDSSALATAVQKLKGEQLEDMFDNMQIQVLGAKEEEKSEASFESEDDSDDGITESHFQEDENKISQKHARHTDIEERD